MIQFGTGGWRAVIGDGFTRENIRRVAAALARRMKQEGCADEGLCVGYDRRFLSREALIWFCEVLARDMLLSRLWGIDYYGNTRTLDQHIGRIRQKLGADGARIITLENAVRFLTDYLNGDTYYHIERPEHNLDRTRTQMALTAEMEKNDGIIRKMMSKILNGGKQ